MDIRPHVVLAAVAVVWGSVGVIVREVPLPAVAIVAARIWIAAAALGAWLVLRHRGPLGALGAHAGRVVATGAVLAVHWMLLFAALKRAPIGTVLLITYLAPVAIAVLAPKLLGERVPRRVLAGLAVALLGLVLVAAPGIGVSTSGVVLAGGAAVLYVVFVLVGKPLSEEHGGDRLAFVQLVVAGAVLVPFALAAEWGDPSWAWGWLLPLGLVHTAAGVGVFLWALSRLPATEVGVLTYLEPASAVLFGWVFLAEGPGPATVAGGALIVAAGVLVIRGAAGNRAGIAPSQPLPAAEVTDVPR